MKTGQIFWGVFFLTVGGLILVDRYDLISMEWFCFWDFWPVILILWGLAIITKESFLKPLITILIALFVAGLVYGAFSSMINGISDMEWDRGDDTETTFFEEYDSTANYADLTLSAGVGVFTIKDRTGYLIKGNSRGGDDNYGFTANKSGDKFSINVNMEHGEINLLKRDKSNRLELLLNSSPIWSLDLNLGAARSNFDLSDFKVSNLYLKTGATKTKIKLGDKYSTTDVKIEMGAANLDIAIPVEAGCRLSGDMVLMSKDLQGFTKKGEDYYETENFNNALQKIYIKVDGGVSSLDINRY